MIIQVAGICGCTIHLGPIVPVGRVLHAIYSMQLYRLRLATKVAAQHREGRIELPKP